MTRPDGRQANQLRELKFERDFTEMALGFEFAQLVCLSSIWPGHIYSVTFVLVFLNYFGQRCATTNSGPKNL